MCLLRHRAGWRRDWRFRVDEDCTEVLHEISTSRSSRLNSGLPLLLKQRRSHGGRTWVWRNAVYHASKEQYSRGILQALLPLTLDFIRASDTYMGKSPSSVGSLWRRLPFEQSFASEQSLQ